MMRDILTGGACNVNGDSSQQVNVNPFNRFMGTIFTGQAQNADRIQGFQPGVPQGDLMKNALNERGQMMGIMNKEFDALSKDFNNMNINNTMEQNFRQQQHIMNQQHAHLDHVFMHQQTMMAQEARMREQMMHHQFQQQQHLQAQRMLEMEKNMSAQFDSTKAQLEAEDMARELMMENALDAAEKEGIEEDIKQQIIQQNANELYDKMAGDSSPRIKNSKFLQFMGQIKTGELKIEGDQLVQGDPTQVQDMNKIFDNAWARSEEEQKDSEKLMSDNYNLEAYWQQKIQEYEKERLNDDGLQEKLEKDYADVLKHMEETEDDDDDMEAAWQNASESLQQDIQQEASDHYQFQLNNPYLAHENPLHLALEFITQGNISGAILALEAQLQKNPNAPSNANSWRILGRLHQENDQDQRAVACFLNALKKDNTNPDTFLALGVSCTNILDEVKAMNFLKHWYMISDIQKQLPIDPQLVPEEKEYSEFSLEEIKAINKNMLDAFVRARNFNPQSPELNVGLAVLQYISRDYAGSVDSFRQALKYDPTNYSLWNKLGATLAQLGRSDEAIEAYYKALELKPNYVRVWVNLGIAHAYKQDYSEAARLYLNALSFNPEAKHLWSYLQTCFMCLQRFDLVSKISQQNPALFSDEFEILQMDQLPQPEVNYNESTKKYLISENEINQWLSEFKSQPPM